MFKDNPMNKFEKPDFNFELQTFPLMSFSMIILLVATIFLSLYGLAFLAFPLTILFIAYPKSYKYLQLDQISIHTLHIADKYLSKLNFLPGIDFAGIWFIEPVAKRNKLNSPIQILWFMLTRIFEITFITLGFIAFQIRVIYTAYGSPAGGPIYMLYDRPSLLYMALSSIIGVLGLIFYMTWVWVWRDAGLKKIRFKTSSKGGRKEIVSMKPASTSALTLLSYFTGFGSWFWLFNPKWSNSINELFNVSITGGGNDAISQIIQSILTTYGLGIFLLVFVFIIFSGPIFLLAITYLRSGVHEYFVNKLRYHVREQYTINLVGELPCEYCEEKGIIKDNEQFYTEKGIGIGTSISIEISSNYIGNLGNEPPHYGEMYTPTIPLDRQVIRDIKCPDCGYINGRKMKYCQKCGVHLFKVLEKYNFCYTCGAENAANTKFCNACGNLLLKEVN